MIQNKRDLRRYYGSTSLSPPLRFRLHILELQKGIHFNPGLQRAFVEFGEDTFEFTVIGRNLDKPQALKLERLSCEQTLDFCYNHVYVRTRVEHPMRGRKHTEEMRIAAGDRARGRAHSAETRTKMSKTALERKRYLSLLEYIESKKTAIKDNLGNKFESLTEAAAFHGIKVMTACDIIKGRHNFTRAGVSLKRCDDETPWPTKRKSA